MAVIELDGLTKFYGKHRGVIDVSLRVDRGEVFGFLGPNGAGKTTTIRVLLDLIRPTSGSARVLGLDCRRDGVELRRRIGYLPGDLALFEHMTGRRFLEHVDELRGRDDAARRAELIERFGLDDRRKIGELSTGNRQKLGIIQAFVHHPEVLILDEPTSGLDPLLQLATYELIEEARSEGRTVFLSSHILSEVERLAGRVGVVREGRLLEVATVADLKERAVRVADVQFDGPAPDGAELLAISGVVEAVVEGAHARMRIEGTMDALVKALAGHTVVSIRTHEADLEQIFLQLYEGTA